MMKCLSLLDLIIVHNLLLVADGRILQLQLMLERVLFLRNGGKEQYIVGLLRFGTNLTYFHTFY